MKNKLSSFTFCMEQSQRSLLSFWFLSLFVSIIQKNLPNIFFKCSTDYSFQGCSSNASFSRRFTTEFRSKSWFQTIIKESHFQQILHATVDCLWYKRGSILCYLHIAESNYFTLLWPRKYFFRLIFCPKFATHWTFLNNKKMYPHLISRRVMILKEIKISQNNPSEWE